MSKQINKKSAFKSHVLQWARELDVEIRSITIRPMRTKWASCSTGGRLTFDASLPDLSNELQDYVIVHELLHFRVPNHGKLWKIMMRAHLGEYEDMEKKLGRLSR